MKMINRKDIQNTIEERTTMMFSIGDFDIDFHNNLTEIEELDKKTIFAIERIVRNSYEYRNYIRYLKEELDLTKCALIESMDSRTLPVALEFHHHPFTLFDLTDIIGRAMIKKNAEIGGVSLFDIAKEITSQHYRGQVGLVPLTKTLHQMAHNGSIIVPLSKVNGQYNRFINEYRDHIDPEQLSKIETLKSYGESQEAKELNNSKLKKDVLTYDIGYDGDVEHEE